jgi:hypothetical protein
MEHKEGYLKMFLENHSITSICKAAEQTKFTCKERLFCFVVSSIANSAIGAYFGYTIWKPDPSHTKVESTIVGFLVSCVWDKFVFDLPVKTIMSTSDASKADATAKWKNLFLNWFAYVWGTMVIGLALGLAIEMLDYGCKAECTTQATFTVDKFVYFDGVQQSSFTNISALSTKWPFAGSEEGTCEKLLLTTFPSTVLPAEYAPRMSGVKMQPPLWDSCSMLTTPMNGIGIAGCTCSVSTVGLSAFVVSWLANFCIGTFISEPIKIAVKYALTVKGKDKLASYL